jgi:molybdopterin-guanine dinucleotide biosynthesis protein A
MPFLPAPLLRALVEHGLRADVPAVAPASSAGGGWEPLCAWYSCRALPAVERRLARGEGSLHGLLDSLGAEPLPPDVVRRWGPPEVVFMNVNTVEDLRAARRLAEEEARDGG